MVTSGIVVFDWSSFVVVIRDGGRRTSLVTVMDHDWSSFIVVIRDSRRWTSLVK